MSTDAPAKAPRTDTRQRTLEVAAHLFATRGFAGTSIKDISDELGVTKAALYYHFASKEEILQEIVRQPLLAVREVMDNGGPIETAEQRKHFVSEVVGAMANCDADVIAVFKDPGLAPQVDNSITTTGVTHLMSLRLAMSLSGTDDPARVDPQHMMRAIAAVGAGYEAIRNWHFVYPECERFTEPELDVISSLVSDVLEAGKP